MIAFVPLFFFASEYAQISLGESASETGLYLLIFFAGFADRDPVGRQNARPDRGAAAGASSAARSARSASTSGASSMTHLSVSEQWYYIVLAGLGVGLVLSPANTDALNRVARSRYGEATGITQTVAQLRLQPRPGDPRLAADHLEQVEPGERARRQRPAEGQSRRRRRMRLPGRSAPARPVARHALGPKATGEVFGAVPMSFAEATRDVFHGMAIALAIALRASR